VLSSIAAQPFFIVLHQLVRWSKHFAVLSSLLELGIRVRVASSTQARVPLKNL
jgi:hypothetical protein